MNLYKKCDIERCITIKSLYTAFSAQFDEHYSFDGEAHDFWEMVYVKRGTVGVVADDNIYNLTEGKLILHPPMQFHRIWSEGNESPEVTVISFDADFKALPTDLIFDVSEADGEGLKQILDSIHSAFIMEGRAVSILKPGYLSQAQITVNQLENILLSLSESSTQISDINVPSNRKYAEIVKILADNTDKSISLDFIAAECAMSVSSLKKIFLKYSGMGVKQYFNRMKIRQAVQYLRDGYSVKETSAKLGFTDQNYFSMFFKNQTGSSPTNYIKNENDSENDE